ncbi:HdeD family acid-resistance protein [Fructilactobacillus carniphilus]|uniref:DUF308 domain-containing protein n=1 Tax=Fructilactobacillus carniphilus TaxID=2940297 RepID=A0ABY5BWH6_9LACO|nr:DUF308 domain-containing protein [Fructilactobacillus carniphilus]USS90323.1 DUF308 domain-containing protein [Fructilactobacillus carniphilus]
MFSSERKFDPFTLVVGILFAILSLVMLKYPGGSLVVVAYIIAFAMVMEGIFKLADLTAIDKSLGISNTWVIISAVLDLILGVLIIFMPGLGGIYLWVVLSISFIMDSLFELWASRYISKNQKGYFWFTVILAVIGLILGIVLLFNPVLGVSTSLFLIAFYLMFFGILLIIRSF